MLFEFRQTGKELYSAEFWVVNENGDMLGTASFKGNMVSVYGNWNISLLSMNISLERITARRAVSLTGGLTKDKPFGAMEILIDGVSRGVVFQGIHKKSLFKEYTVHHIVYDKQKMFCLYPIGFGADGSKSPVYLESAHEAVQIAQINKDSIVRDDMHSFFCYVLEEKDVATVVIFCALMYSMGCYHPGIKIIKGVKRTNSKTLEPELLSKYVPNFVLTIGKKNVAAGKASISRKGKTNMKNHIIIFSVLMMFCFVAAGCSSMSLKDIDGDIRCEFRTGENAKFADAAVNTDATFEKEEFVKLYNKANSYNPNRIKDHLNECDLRINSETQPDAWKEIFGSEVNIKMLYGEKEKSVSVYRYGSKLYFFVVSMGGRTRPKDKGYYYIELSEEADRYWRPILDKVIREG